jgi:hypothetical protein
VCCDGLDHAVGVEPPIGIQKSRPCGQLNGNSFRNRVDIDELAEHATRGIHATNTIDNPPLVAKAGIGVMLGKLTIMNAKCVGVAATAVVNPGIVNASS